MHFIFRKYIILIFFLWRSWHSPDFWWNVDPPLKPKTFSLLNPGSKCSPWCLMGPICSTCVHSYICATFIPNRSSRLTTFPRLLNCWRPNTPKNAAVGRIVFSLCPFPDVSIYVYRIWCQSVHPFCSFPILEFVTPYNPRNEPCGNEWRNVFSYVHSQTNPQTCTTFGANRSSRLTASQDFWTCDPLKPQVFPCVSKGNLFSVYPLPNESARVPNLVTIGPAVWQLQQTFEFVTL